MSVKLVVETTPEAIPVTPVIEIDFSNWLHDQPEAIKAWTQACNFKAKPGSTCFIASKTNELEHVLVGVESLTNPFELAALPANLPPNIYLLDANITAEQEENLALGWALGGYRFDRYRKVEHPQAHLALSGACDLNRVTDKAAAIMRVRDLINTPAADMMPRQLAETVAELAETHGGKFSEIVGNDLLKKNYPTIHTVGRASVHRPRLIELNWGDNTHPKVTIVGKGICFDSGGLDLKAAQFMRFMKKDMGGAANAIGLAELIMRRQLPIHLQLLIPAAENAVSSNAYRPGDVIKTRLGKTVEVDNTDAEGRLVLCDALAAACERKPDLVLDFATLTGAARVAMGTDLPAMFCNSDQVAEAIFRAGLETSDGVWRMPLHDDYRSMLDSTVADLTNCAAAPYGGAITAALFLKEFVSTGIEWAHFDIMAWNLKPRPGRPEGGEAMGIRAVYAYLEKRFR